MIYIVKRGKASSGAPGSGVSSQFYDKTQAKEYAKAKAKRDHKIIRIYQIPDRGGTPTLLEAVSPTQENPPTSKWIPAKAVKFNRNGSVSIRKTGSNSASHKVLGYSIPKKRKKRNPSKLRVGSSFTLSNNALDNYGSQYAGKVYKVKQWYDHVGTDKHGHRGYDIGAGGILYHTTFPKGDLYDWEMQRV